MYCIFFDTPLGRIELASENGNTISRLCFLSETALEKAQCETPVLRWARAQLLEYFGGTRKSFDLPLAPRGTVFQRKVWNSLLRIPYGQTRSYGDVAVTLGKPGAAKAVGGACHRNPIPILIPCHRVVGADGGLTGFGCGLDLKQELLNLECQKGGFS